MRKAFIKSIADVFHIIPDALELAARIRTASELLPPTPPPSSLPPPTPTQPSLPQPIFQEHLCKVNCAALSVDGRHIIAGGSNTTAEVRSTATGDLISIFDEHPDQVKCVAISPTASGPPQGAVSLILGCVFGDSTTESSSLYARDGGSKTTPAK